MHLPFSKVGSPTLKIGLAETIMAYLSIMHVPLYVVHHACGQPCMVLPRFPKIPLSDLYAEPPGGPGRWPLPGPLCFLWFFLFSPARPQGPTTRAAHLTRDRTTSATHCMGHGPTAKASRWIVCRSMASQLARSQPRTYIQLSLSCIRIWYYRYCLCVLADRL